MLSFEGEAEAGESPEGLLGDPWLCQLICCATPEKALTSLGPSVFTFRMAVITTQQK